MFSKPVASSSSFDSVPFIPCLYIVSNGPAMSLTKLLCPLVQALRYAKQVRLVGLLVPAIKVHTFPPPLSWVVLCCRLADVIVQHHALWHICPTSCPRD